ncbi:hypothetical protein [Granulicatella adiacens]|uniref:hypothetical protein n=1 Tax=Granulicatella adiacens TaxID=46124 RepID=UPI003C6FCFAA
MELLEYIASWTLDYIVSQGMPATKMLITSALKMDGKTYRKEIAKLKKEGLIRVERVYFGDWYEEGIGLNVRGWALTEKARELESVKRIEKEIEERIEQVFGIGRMSDVH